MIQVGCYCSIQPLSHVLHLRPHGLHTRGFPVLHHLLEKFAQTHIHSISDAIQPSHPLASFFLLQASICPRIRAFSNELALRNWPDLAWWWPKYWSFSSSISPFMGYLELISDCFDFFAVQGLSRVFPTTKFWASILQCSEFMVQFSHSYMTTGKTIGLTRWTFVSNVSAF